MKTLITGALHATASDLSELKALGLETTLQQDEQSPVLSPAQYEAVICNSLFLYHDISQFTNLRIIQLTSAGLDRVPMDYVLSHGIRLYNAAGVYSIPMAEWTIMRILELYKKSGELSRNQQQHLWKKDMSWLSLAGKTACIIGFGAYGQETAKRLKAFGVRILCVNRTRRGSDLFDQYYPLEKINTALSEADIVIMALGLADETKGIIDAARFDAMKQGTIFLNAARGSLVDEAALCRALERGQLAGAALDVFETEPLPDDSPLWTQRNVLLSPHNSFVSEQNHEKLIKLVKGNLKDL